MVAQCCHVEYPGDFGIQTVAMFCMLHFEGLALVGPNAAFKEALSDTSSVFFVD